MTVTQTAPVFFRGCVLLTVTKGATRCHGAVLTAASSPHLVSTSAPEAAASLVAVHEKAAAVASIARASITVEAISQDASTAASLAELPGAVYDEARVPEAWEQVRS